MLDFSVNDELTVLSNDFEMADEKASRKQNPDENSRKIPEFLRKSMLNSQLFIRKTSIQEFAPNQHFSWSKVIWNIFPQVYCFICFYYFCVTKYISQISKVRGISRPKSEKNAWNVLIIISGNVCMLSKLPMILISLLKAYFWKGDIGGFFKKKTMCFVHKDACKKRGDVWISFFRFWKGIHRE